MKLLARFILPISLVLLLASAPARAEYDPVASGSVQLVLAKSFAAVLAKQHVKIQPEGGARRKGGAIRLAATGGEVEPQLGLGTVEATGAIVFTVGNRKMPLRKIVFKSKRAPLYAKVGGGQLKIATGARLSVARSGFATRFTAADLHLTAKVATRLNKKLRLDMPLSAGQKIGKLVITAAPATVHLQQGSRMHLSVNPAFFSKLNQLFVSLNPIAPAELAPGPDLSFPVGEGSILAPDGRAGVVKLEGSVELLQLGNAQMFWRELWFEPDQSTLLSEVDVEPAPPYGGKQPQAPFFGLAGDGSVESDPGARKISFAGKSLTLSAAAAAALNDAFAKGTPTFATGEPVGTVSLAAQELFSR
ncbi:MAG: hypothetical protein ACJ76D_05220 [Solirubrobacterales bacterium]